MGADGNWGPDDLNDDPKYCPVGVGAGAGGIEGLPGGKWCRFECARAWMLAAEGADCSTWGTCMRTWVLRINSSPDPGYCYGQYECMMDKSGRFMYIASITAMLDLTL